MVKELSKASISIKAFGSLIVTGSSQKCESSCISIGSSLNTSSRDTESGNPCSNPHHHWMSGYFLTSFTNSAPEIQESYSPSKLYISVAPLPHSGEMILQFRLLINSSPKASKIGHKYVTYSVSSCRISPSKTFPLCKSESVYLFF